MSQTVITPEILEATPEPEPFEGLIDLSRSLQAIARHIFDPLCERRGLNRLPALILLHLHRAPGQPPSHLSFALHAQRANIASALRALESQGLVATVPSETDKRSRVVYLTEAGRQEAEDLSDDLDAARFQLETRVPPENRELLVRAWGTLRETFATLAKELDEETRRS